MRVVGEKTDSSSPALWIAFWLLVLVIGWMLTGGEQAPFVALPGTMGACSTFDNQRKAVLCAAHRLNRARFTAERAESPFLCAWPQRRRHGQQSWCASLAVLCWESGFSCLSWACSPTDT